LSQQKQTDVSELIAEEFGANAEYVQGLLERFRSNPDLVDDSWRSYFSEILGNGDKVAPTPETAGNARVARADGSAAAAPAPRPKPTEARPSANVPTDVEAIPLRGAALKIVENMERSLSVPTATSERRIPVKLLDENRRLINKHLAEHDRGKVSYTHLIAWALVRALETYPQLNDGFFDGEGGAARLKRPLVNLGIAVDLTKKDGSRSLLVPNIKNASSLSFSEFLAAYDDVIKRARNGKLQVADFQGTTVSLTNPGTIGTVASIPRLMEGQSVIIATGAIEYPAEYQAMAPEALSQLGISKAISISSTYDHRIIQGAESGAFLALIHEFIIGKHEFYDTIFADLGIPHVPFRWNTDRNPFFLASDQVLEQSIKEARVIELINAYRVRGHLIADTDPLHALPRLYHAELDIETYGLTIWDLDRVFTTDGLANKQASTLREILDVLQRAYCGKVGIEYRHIQSKEEKTWIRDQIRREFVQPEPIPAEVKKRLLWKLISAEQFERFLHTKYLGQKRFSLEGCETVISILDCLIEGAGARGVEEIMFGMAHRGRLNVLANVIGNLCERIFAAFEGSVHPEFPADEGDVKYHQGAKGERVLGDGRKVQLTLSPNPSHLEAVDPVVEGMVRAKQDEFMGQRDLTREEVMDLAMPVLLHGDAAFAGQGVVMETLNLAGLKGYRTGGTIHIIINNQIGFTTSPEAGRSTIYSTDVARMTQLPIFHINGDDPEAAYRVLRIALNYRQEFNKDVVLDLIGFRRLGHNETDEPSYTQPLMYARVKAHPGVRTIYAKRLIKEGVVTEEEVKNLIDERVRRYEEALGNAKRKVANEPPQTHPPVEELDGSEVIPTGVAAETIRSIAHKIAVVPEEFNVNPKMVGQLARRAKMGDGALPLDWGFAEAIAFGSLVLEGTRVRLSGQDSGRGTFSQRHAVLYDTQTGKTWAPLGELESETNPAARFDVFDSSLSEEGVLGFDYGYSVVNKTALVLWEAQFGDFGNGAQTIIDQYIAASEDKWKQTSRVVMLLPHGYEGQGPEHSSARLERYLQLCAENNLQVCYPTTPAQYFHLLRRQVRPGMERPLVVMTPKSLLRLPAAASRIEELATGGFQPVIDDAGIADAGAVRKVVLCSGKVFYDLIEARKQSKELSVAIVRLEQFYPFPLRSVREVIEKYANATQYAWVQEEPHNMGGWTFVRERLERLESLLSDAKELRYIGRTASASPATGSYSVHQKEQAAIVAEALKTE
jgi:2-oxoglutarate dehydrogenase E1 component